MPNCNCNDSGTASCKDKSLRNRKILGTQIAKMLCWHVFSGFVNDFLKSNISCYFGFMFKKIESYMVIF